ncbi:MAG: hypothetical protein SFV22_14975 [Saprospiraceae bacterium]|nr:hypothetical protein [Saprospiraceae bacterium]
MERRILSKIALHRGGWRGRQHRKWKGEFYLKLRSAVVVGEDANTGNEIEPLEPLEPLESIEPC